MSNKWIEHSKQFSNNSGETYKTTLSDNYNASGYYHSKVKDVLDQKLKTPMSQNAKITAHSFADNQHGMANQLYSLEAIRRNTQDKVKLQSLETHTKSMRENVKKSFK